MSNAYEREQYDFPAYTLRPVHTNEVLTSKKDRTTPASTN
jgi:hypothetical protein